MKKTQITSFLKSVTVFTCLLGFSIIVHGEPDWWTDPSTQIWDGATHENYSPVNVGQLKHVAIQAKNYFDENLIGGASYSIIAKLSDFYDFGSESPVEELGSDYAPVNVGQLKALSKPFYDRLISLGYDTQEIIRANGSPTWVGDYPWDSLAPAEENASVVNIGQLKLVFAIDLSFGTPLDTDGDGMTDVFEIQYGFDPYDVSDGYLDADGDGLLNREEYGNISDPYQNSDLDADTLADDWEKFHGLDVLSNVEVMTYDGDLDGLPDVFEIMNGLNHKNPDDSLLDRDGDGLLAIHEYSQTGTDLLLFDSNNNGTSDFFDYIQSSPNQDLDGDGLSNVAEMLLHTLPEFSDTDGDGVSDSNDSDPLRPSLQVFEPFL